MRIPQNINGANKVRCAASATALIGMPRVSIGPILKRAIRRIGRAPSAQYSMSVGRRACQPRVYVAHICLRRRWASFIFDWLYDRRPCGISSACHCRASIAKYFADHASAVLCCRRDASLPLARGNQSYRHHAAGSPLIGKLDTARAIRHAPKFEVCV